jgi:hypothetical protein
MWGSPQGKSSPRWTSARYPIDLPEEDQPDFLAAICIQTEYFLPGDIAQREEYFGKSVRGGQNLPGTG